MKQKVLVILGPTASGKSALGVELARKFAGEIISADSRQVYKGLNIGTGKITKREMKGVPHHLLDVASPKKKFSAGEYVRLAEKIIPTIYGRHKLPIIVGGTGFYIDALLGRMSLPDVPPNPALRRRYVSHAAARLMYLLKRRDPKRAKMMASPSERNNKVRLIRALEIAEALGKAPQKALRPEYEVLWIGIAPPPKVLEKKIQTRLKARVKAGMVGEARTLHAKGLTYRRMEELGLEYRSLARLLQKKIDAKGFEAELYRDIRRYAKKQRAYWRRNSYISWFSKPDATSISKSVRAWLRD